MREISSRQGLGGRVEGSWTILDDSNLTAKGVSLMRHRGPYLGNLVLETSSYLLSHSCFNSTIFFQNVKFRCLIYQLDTLHSRGMCVVFICLLFIYQGFRNLNGKNCLLSVCQPVCLAPCAIICASEVNPAEDLMGSFHSLFFSLGLGLLYAKSNYNMERSQNIVLW